MSDAIKLTPELTRRCPLCGGAMYWCGEIPEEGEDPHECCQPRCGPCGFNVVFDNAEVAACEDMAQARVVVARTWNALEPDYSRGSHG